jgi:hypothetical protein
MEQTAVEWLIFHWIELDKKYYGGEIGRIDYRNLRDAIQAEASEMFEQQIKDAYQTSHISMMTADFYYTEKFK